VPEQLLEERLLGIRVEVIRAVMKAEVPPVLGGQFLPGEQQAFAILPVGDLGGVDLGTCLQLPLEAIRLD